MMPIDFPANSVLWGTAATRNATSWPHLDDHGMATIVKVMTGQKYWVVVRPKASQKSGGDGDLFSSNAFPDDWEPDQASETLWDHEGVVLQSGDLL
jgi:hypothetical protein